ncbi:MAG: SDR family NAD(P)-dependent oxidoreductase [Actinobacteria bacterium]|nr:SDR family NAD(P)-dependent oxidoreductase [Actinomycetota bacterium]
MPSALVTGTSTGIGAACVARLTASGWDVYAGVRRTDDGERLRSTYGDRVRPLPLEVTDPAAVRRALDSVTAEVGSRGLQGLVNNAGIGIGGPIEHVSDADWRTVFDVNLFAVVHLTREAMPLLRAGRGRIVHIGSMGGRVAGPGVGPYSASKHALEALAESMRHELALADDPITVSLVEPGEIRTAIWDKSERQVEEIAAGLDPDGLRRYGYLLDLGRGFVADGRTHGAEPSTVAAAVAHALTARRPKARYLVGSDARLAGHVVSKLPDRVRDPLVRTRARLMVRAGKRLREGDASS